MAPHQGHTTVSDEDLILAVARREPESARKNAEQCYDELYRRHSRAFVLYFTNRVPQAHRSDLCQELWLKLWQSAHRFDGRDGRAWLYRIAHNLVVDLYRKLGRVTAAAPAQEDNLFDHRHPDALEVLLDEERQALFKHCLEKLPAEWRELILSRIHDDVSYDALTEQTGLTKANLQKRWFRAKKELTDCVSKSRP
jgi:RNA polymerase sigma-70 factor, ECF subfamily